MLGVRDGGVGVAARRVWELGVWLGMRLRKKRRGVGRGGGCGRVI